MLIFVGRNRRLIMVDLAENSNNSNDSDGFESAAVKAVAELVGRAERAGASDVHLQMCGVGEARAQVAFRLNGLMAPVDEFPAAMAGRVFGRIKYLARLKTYQDSLPQDGRIAKEDIDAAHDVRVATYPTVTGEKIVLRFFPEAAQSLDELGYQSEPRAVLENFLKSQSGLLLLTGPAGSGKTTTIYSCLRHLAQSGGRHIITVEDPVEQVLPGIMQTEVNEARGLTFATAARHLMRQDPQVLAIGEIRDEETARIAVRAALTGHLVISTLHAGSCSGVLERLLAMCPDRYAVVAALALVFNQRLIRRLCTECAGKGCGDCLETGYKNRLPISEWARMDDALRARVRETGASVFQPAKPLAAAGKVLLKENLTNAAELERVLGS